MAAIRFYTDEHVGGAVIHGLLQRGIDVLTVVAAGMVGASDEEHLTAARRDVRVVFTQGDEFLKLHAAGVEHAGIVYAPQGRAVGDVIRGLVLIQQVLTPEETANHVEFL